MKKEKLSLSILAGLFFLYVIVPQTMAQPFVLTKVVDTNTPIPGGSGNFTVFLYGPSPPYAVSEGNVAFQAGGESGQYGIYLFNGTTVSTVADYNTPIPGGSGNFTFFSSDNQVISENKIVFYGAGGSGQNGIYLFNGTLLSAVADINTPIPAGSGNFSGFGNPVISGNNIAFAGSGAGQLGIYLFNGSILTKVADYNTPVPEGSGSFNAFYSLAISGRNVAFGAGWPGQEGIYLFDGTTLSKVVDGNTPPWSGTIPTFSDPVISDGNVAFRAGNATLSGIYSFNGTNLTKVADTDTLIPGGSGNFTSFSTPVISGGNVAFQGIGYYGGQDGIYLFNGTTLNTVVDINTPIPNGTGNFTSFAAPVMINGNVAFFGAGSGQGGIYLFNGTTLSKVADITTTIPGGSGNFTGFSEPVINDGKVVFGAGGTGLQGIYLASSASPWTISTIDSAGDVGGFSSIAVDSNNNVHISYFDNTNADLKYATNVSGSWQAFTIDSTGDVGGDTSIAVDTNNKVHIGYYNWTNGHLTYAANSSGSWEISSVDAAGFQGANSYIDIATDSNNKVHISYLQGINLDLKYATNSSGIWEISIIDNTPFRRKSSSIAIDPNNKAHISYYDLDNSDLKYATNVSGSWLISTVDHPGGWGGETSIATDSDSNVHISYRDYPNTDLKYATNASGSWQVFTVDGPGDVGGYSSIAIDSNNKVHISYFDWGNIDLKYATNASGSWVTSTLDSAGFVGRFTSIAVDSNDRVHISYYDETNGDLKYATNATVCTSPIITSQPQSQTIQSGQLASLSVSASGTSPLSYLWYQGSSGDTSNPISGAVADVYITPPLTQTTNYWVRVSNGCGTADSNRATITVAAAGISVASPNGGEGWTTGSTQTIRWTYFGNPGSYVKIELLKGGVVNRIIKSSNPKGSGGNGSCSWVMPANQTPGSNYRIRITSTSNGAYTDTSDSDFTIAAPTLIVVSPNGGETLTAGTTQTIRWTYTGNPGSYVKIELLKGGVLNRIIKSLVSKGSGGNGSFNWIISDTQAAGSDYQVRITSTSNSSYSDISDNNLTIVQPSSPAIGVLSPNGGEIWGIGSTETIRWSYAGNPGSYVKVELLKGGVLNRTIISSTSKGRGGNGSRNWTIPANQVPGSDYRIRVTSTANGAYTDMSDADFTIAAPSITVVSPNGGETWTTGTMQTIRWSYIGNPGSYVKVELLKGGVLVRVLTTFAVEKGTGGNGSYSWRIPLTQAPGSDYQIRVTSMSNNFYSDTSDSTFAISK